MISTPDGVEVVGTRAEAGGLDSPPLLIVDRVAAYLDDLGVAPGRLSWARIGDGQSNVTYLLERAGTQLVLRRGPRPPIPRSAHDMPREAAVQMMLGEVGFAVPKIIAVCEDPAVLGVPFYLMEYLDGVVLTDDVPAGLDDLAKCRAISDATVDTLLSLHRVDAGQAPFAGFARPTGYLGRQVDRFTALSEADPVRSLPLVRELSRWLSDTQPVTQRAAVVHGDFRLGNVMFAPGAPVRVIAVLDWEMATIGDPLADLGYLTATYAEADSAPSIMELTPVTRGPGFANRAGLIERYAAGSDLDLERLPWYQALALWKAAVFCEAIYRRWLAGERPGDDFGPRLEAGVPALLRAAAGHAGLASG